MIFTHTFLEKRMWRGWLKNGQSVEISWDRHGWEFGGGVHIHTTDNDMGDRMLFLKLWRATMVIPLGIILHPWPPMEGPQWSVYASGECGLVFCWGFKRNSFDWPWAWHTLAYEHQLPDGSWASVFSKWDEGSLQPYEEQHPYTYLLRSGEVQRRTATVQKRRHVLCYRMFKALGWPRWIRESINVDFDGEIGEQTGSWKGGCVGTGQDILPGENMEQALRRMEAERKF